MLLLHLHPHCKRLQQFPARPLYLLTKMLKWSTPWHCLCKPVLTIGPWTKICVVPSACRCSCPQKPMRWRSLARPLQTPLQPSPRHSHDHHPLHRATTCLPIPRNRRIWRSRSARHHRRQELQTRVHSPCDSKDACFGRPMSALISCFGITTACLVPVSLPVVCLFSAHLRC